jgi:glutaconate CoA-transferase subunit A
MAHKLKDLSEAAALVKDGELLALGGNLMHRIPAALVRELARQGRMDLEVVKTAGAYDIDLLAAAGCLRGVHAGYVGFEAEFGLAPNYRRAVEEGRIKAFENACATVIAGLRAAAYGIPFQPVGGLRGSDLPTERGFEKMKSPYGEEEVYLIPAIRPDWALIHVQAADAEGNARIEGTLFEDILMTRAAKGVILSAEAILSSEELARTPEQNLIPGFLVSAVAHVPGGARPGSCFGHYDVDSRALSDYLARSQRDLASYLEGWDRVPARYAR